MPWRASIVLGTMLVLAPGLAVPLRAADAPREPRDLPITAVPAKTPSTRLALLISGDGGWAGIDKGVAEELAARGVPVIGVSSLKYFWKKRTVERTTDDMVRALRYYLDRWKSSHILLVGYSFGADVMPFVYNRLPPDLRARVQTLTLLAVGEKTDFEVHVSGWAGVRPEDGLEVAPEVARAAPLPVLCLYGESDDESRAGCARLKHVPLTVKQVGDGHHFGWLYGDLAQHILDFAPAR